MEAKARWRLSGGRLGGWSGGVARLSEAPAVLDIEWRRKTVVEIRIGVERSERTRVLERERVERERERGKKVAGNEGV